MKTLTITLAVAAILLLITATPAHADGEGSSIGASAEYPVRPGGAGSSGLTGCEVVAFENGELVSHEFQPMSGLPQRTTVVIEKNEPVESGEVEREDGVIYEYGGDDEVTFDSDDIGSDDVGNGIKYDHGIVDGVVELESGPARVYEITGCDQYSAGQIEIVVAPDQATSLIPGLRVALEEQLPTPELILRPFDDNNDWTYVQVPIDIRVTPESLAPLTLTADTGGPDFATDADGNNIQIRRTMTTTATPRVVIFQSGDPRAAVKQLECNPVDALAPYVEETPGACSYQYSNSSSVTDSNAFEAEVLVEWDVEFTRNDGPGGTFDVDPTLLEEAVRVAEVKAVNVYNR